MVAIVQRLALLQIPLAVLIAPMVRLVSALKANQHLLWAALIHLSANVVLDYVLMRAMGVAGIALATVFVAVIYFCYLCSVLCMKLRVQRHLTVRDF
jgi:Na+-driven multidrug efflux pump